jgi:hypothetical protein
MPGGAAPERRTGMADDAAILATTWHPDDAYVHDALREAAFRRLHLIYNSSNDVFLAELEHPHHGAGLAIYKPASGETPLHDFPHGTIHHREIAAYEFARLLGWTLIPPTVPCEGPRGEGSLQLFIEHNPAEHYFVLRRDASLDALLVRMAVFDLIANNADRKGGHVLRDPQGRLWGIDNGLCFHRDEKLRTVIWDFAGTPIPQPLLDDIERVRAQITAGDSAAEACTSHLSPLEVDALLVRCAQLLAEPVLPEMYPWRCVPWPLV